MNFLCVFVAFSRLTDLRNRVYCGKRYPQREATNAKGKTTQVTLQAVWAYMDSAQRPLASALRQCGVPLAILADRKKP